MAFNPGGLLDSAGEDAVLANTRVRAMKVAQTFTDSSGAVTIAASPLGTNYIDGAGAPQTISGATQTIPANALLNGVVVCRPSGATTYTTDTAANILAACNAVSPGGVQVGDYLPALIMNDSGFAMTMGMGTGVTSANASTNSLPANTSRYCQFRFTNVTSGSAALTMFF